MTNRQALVNAGWNPQVAEALDENQHTPETAQTLGIAAFDLYLEWNGIIGFTRGIMNALDNCRNMEALRAPSGSFRRAPSHPFPNRNIA